MFRTATVRPRRLGPRILYNTPLMPLYLNTAYNLGSFNYITDACDDSLSFKSQQMRAKIPKGDPHGVYRVTDCVGNQILRHNSN